MSANSPSGTPHEPNSQNNAETITLSEKIVFSLWALSLFFGLGVLVLVIADMTLTNKDLSQTAASWMQGIGVPVAIFVTIWGVKHQLSAQGDAERKKQKYEAGERERANIRHRRSALVKLHIALQDLAEKCLSSLAELRTEGKCALDAIGMYQLSAKQRNAFRAADLSVVPSGISRSVSSIDFVLDFLELEILKLKGALEDERAKHDRDLRKTIPFAQFVAGQTLVVVIFESLVMSCADEIEASIRDIDSPKLSAVEATTEDVQPSASWTYTSDLKGAWPLMRHANVAKPPIGAA